MSFSAPSVRDDAGARVGEAHARGPSEDLQRLSRSACGQRAPAPPMAARRPVGGLFSSAAAVKTRAVVMTGAGGPPAGKVRPVAGGLPRCARPWVDASAAYGEAACRRPVAGFVVGGRRGTWGVRHAGRWRALPTRSADRCAHSALVVKI